MKTKIKILFVYVNPLKIPYIDLGIASLSAYLNNREYETKLIDFTFNSNIKKAIKILKQYSPDLVSFSSRSGEFSEIVRIAKIFKDNHRALYVCGGIHPTIVPKEVIIKDCFDGIGIGEGEKSLLDLVRALKNEQDYYLVKGFWFKQGNKIIKNSLPILINDLNELPLMHYDLFDINLYLKIRCGQIDYVSARGCPFLCTYCVNHKLMMVYQGLGPYSRRKSAFKIIKELEMIKMKYPQVKSLKIADENFIMDKQRLKELSVNYQADIGLPFECDARADFCDEETMQLLKKMGCDKLNIAIESGNEELRNNLLNKKISNKQIINAFELARKYKIHTMSFNMVGLPLETKEQIYQTIELNKLAKPDSIQVSIFTPFKGTNAYEYCKKSDLLLSDKIENSYYYGIYLKNPNLSNKELKKIYTRFAYYCYKDRSFFMACILLFRDLLIPYYLKYGNYIPQFIKRLSYFIFWTLKVAKFVSK